MNRRTSAWRTQLRMTAWLTVVLTLAAGMIASPSYAATWPPTDWLVKGQDLQPWNPGGNYPDIGMAAAASDNNLTLPSFTWTLCGSWNGTVYGKSDYTPCTSKPGSTLVVENYDELKAAIADGLFTQLHMQYAMYDLESWVLTPPAQAANPPYWIKQAVTLANQNGIKLIVTTGGRTNTVANDEAAVADNAYMVAVQSQSWGWDKTTASWSLDTFDARVRYAVRAMRATRTDDHTDTLIMLGLGTNTWRVHPVSLLQSEFSIIRALSVSDVWLNANNWQANDQCTAADGGYGCPLIGAQFLSAP